MFPISRENVFGRGLLKRLFSFNSDQGSLNGCYSAISRGVKIFYSAYYWPDHADKASDYLFSNARPSGEMPDPILLLRLPEAFWKNIHQACANPAFHYPPDCGDKQAEYKT